MQQWVDTQVLIDMTIEAYDNGNIPPEYWEMRDAGKILTQGTLNVEWAKQSLQDLHECRVYEIDGRIGRLFALTPNTPRIIQIPFPKTFLNLAIDYNKTLITGIMVKRDNTYGDGDVLIQVMCRKVIKPIPKGMSVSQYLKRIDPNEQTEIGGYTIWLNEDKYTDLEKKMNKICGGGIANLLRRIVMNFNDFLEHPEIKVLEHKRTNQEKRAKRGKLPLPNSSTIVVKGELKIYVDSIQPKDGEIYGLEKCFEVAGHWRRFRHPKYVNMRGKKTFIHPYIKGSGTPEIKRRKIPITKLIREECL